MKRGQEKKNKTRKRLIKRGIIVSGILIPCSMLFISYSYVNSINSQLKQTVLPNTTVEGMNLEGKTKQEVEQAINNKVSELKNKRIMVSSLNQKKEFSYEDIGISYKREEISKQIFEAQEKTGLWERIQLKRAADNGERKASYTLTPFIQQEKFDKFIAEKFKDCVVEPLDAKIKLTDEGADFEVTESKDGQQVNKNEFQTVLLESLKNENPLVSVPFEAVKPKLTTEKAKDMGINHIMATYATKLGQRSSNPLKNIQIAASKLNGTLLAPGEEFSYKKKVGKASIENGYLEAPVYANGKVEKGVGGGICQVASTLYNAALYADFEILARTNHSRTVSYLPIGRDATIDDDGPDLRFKNNYNHYIYIKSIIKNGELVIQIYGKPMEKEITLNSKVDKEDDQFVYASSYRTVKEAGKVIAENQLIARSKYHK